MLLLQAVEQYLGSIDTWPSCIITNLVAETPSLPVVAYLTAFFAGNDKPKTLAYRLYRACNPDATNELVRQLFYTRYSLWHAPDTVRRHSIIMMYVWRNLYFAMYHTPQSSSRKIQCQYTAYRPHASASKTQPRPWWLTLHCDFYVKRYCKNILLIKPIFLHVHHIHLYAFHTLYTPAFLSNSDREEDVTP